MSARLVCLPGGARERRETTEIDLRRMQRRARATDALIAAGLDDETACLCLHQLEAGAADAFARAYAYVVPLGVNASVFRSWCVSRGYAEVIGLGTERADRCGHCRRPLSFYECTRVARVDGRVLLRCPHCAPPEAEGLP